MQLFSSEIYVQRRAALMRRMQSGLLLFLGNEESPMNYAANTYPFRQDSTFLYYFGLDRPHLSALIDVDQGRALIFGNDPTLDEIVWTGPQVPLAEQALQVGVTETASPDRLTEALAEARRQGRPLHFLPQYRAENLLRLEAWLGIQAARANEYASRALIEAVVAQREVLAAEEVAEVEDALAVSYEMHTEAMRITRPGLLEQEVVGGIEGVVRRRGRHLAYPIIFSVRGETLHNHHHGNLMEAGQLVVHDSGATSPRHYASDITRTIPVSGRFSDQQREIYQIVLDAQLQAIEAVRPGVPFRDVHLLASRVMTQGLKDLGLMKGDPEEAVAAGAHAVFFQCGLGHMMGLDVHDMEGLGEDLVGYDGVVQRSPQFGLCYLRLAKQLRPGHVLTVEPGAYFIPTLLDRWRAERRHEAFIDYDRFEAYRGFGGIRIEDNLLVTETGNRVLGPPIPKTVEEVEDVATEQMDLTQGPIHLPRPRE